MASIWKNFLPIVKLMHWNMREESPSWNAFYYTPMRFLENIQSGKIETLFDGLEQVAEQSLFSYLFQS